MGWSAGHLGLTVAVALLLVRSLGQAAESKAEAIDAPPVAPGTAGPTSGQSAAARADAALAAGHLAAAAVGYLDAAKQTGQAVYYGKAAAVFLAVGSGPARAEAEKLALEFAARAYSPEDRAQAQALLARLGLAPPAPVTPTSTPAAPGGVAPLQAHALAPNGAPPPWQGYQRPWLVVPPADEEEKDEAAAFERSNPGMMIAGVVLAGLGGAMGVGSLAPLMASECTEEIGGECTHPLWEMGAAMLGMGGALIVVGIPLAIIGGEKVPTGGYAASQPLRIDLGAGSATLSWRR